MTVIEVDIRELSPDPANLRLHPPEQIEKLMASLRRWGQTLPLLIDAGHVVRVGNARLAAMKELGWETVKVVQLDLAPSEWTALSIADNRLHDDSSFDQAALAQVLATLRAEDDELARASGYTLDELDDLLRADRRQEQSPPDDFEEFDETLETEHQCPRCHFKWSGSSSPQEDAA